MDSAQEEEEERHQRHLQEQRRIHPLIENSQPKGERPQLLVTSESVDGEEAGEEPTRIEAECREERVVFP